MSPITFQAAFADGLVSLTGEAFEFQGNWFVVHKGREPYEKQFFVSEIGTGFCVPIAATRNKRVAVAAAKEILRSQPARHLTKCLAKAARFKAKLRVLTK